MSEKDLAQLIIDLAFEIEKDATDAAAGITKLRSKAAVAAWDAILAHDAALRSALARETEARKAAEAEFDRLRQDRYDALNAQTTEGWSAAEWQLRTGKAERERDEALRTVKALTPAANYCLEYKPLLLKAERERDEAVRVLRDIATYGWYAKGAKVARAYLAAREGR